MFTIQEDRAAPSRPRAVLSITLLCAALLVTTATSVLAQIVPTEESLSDLYPGKAYSPYAQRSFPDQVFWGDTHLHTALSVDAGLFGARLGLDDVYRFARGEEVAASSGQPARLGRPLNWLVIADHSDAMGFFNDLAAGKPGIIKYDQAKRWYEGLMAGGEASTAAALDLITTFAQGKIDPEMIAEYSPGGRTYESIWERVIDAAERFNDPGSFTTLIGSTDSHTALSAVEEENFFGKATNAEPSPKRMNHPFTKTENGVFEGYELVASGYTGVWAQENSREAIWDAMERKEVYATTGPRILVRFFGGWDFTSQDLNSRQPAFLSLIHI